MTPRHLVVVPHTHWDREWYRTREEFRHRLLRLVDALLDLLEGDPGFRHFTLDGQAIVLDDYLEARPAARPRIERLVRAGRLLVGPWYVLPDEWLVSGEALIRNLRLGQARARSFGASMPVGYVPDQFGHVGQLPQILAGMGLDCAVLWRGAPRELEETLFHWEAPDGTRVLGVYLVHGYGNAAQLPLEPRALAARLRACAAALAPRSRIASLLLMNGSDHQEPQPGLPAALAAASAHLDGIGVGIGTLPRFVERARHEAPDGLPLWRGELRSGLRAPLLEGCASSRMAQKRADFENDRLLVRYLEPLATWLGELGGRPDRDLLELAWRTAIECHPHDSICGCSVDAVHAEIDTRQARVAQIAGAELARVCDELGARVRASGPCLVAWNPHASGLAQAEGVVELDLGGRGGRPPPLCARDAAGRRLPLRAELVEPGAVLSRFELPAAAAGLDRVDVELAFANRARDHRLRLLARSGLVAGSFEVESAFEVVERPIAPAPDAFGSDRPAERPTGATPQRGFATVSDGRAALTVAGRGCAEVEAVREPDGTTSLATSVLRAVGWLSRDDLAARPGHAGPALATPGAQAQGAARCEISLRLHAAGEAERTAEAHRYSSPPLLFAGGGAAAGPLADGARLLELDDPAVVVSAVEPDAAGGAEIRLVNASAEARRVRLRWNGRAGGLSRVDLRGAPRPGAAVDLAPDGSASLELRPFEIAAFRAGPDRA